MRKKPPNHNAVFDDIDFASRYAEKHQRMAQNLGKKYVSRLRDRGFTDGKLLDMGCGFGGTLLFIADHFPGATFTGIDLSEPLLKLAISKCDEKGLTNRVKLLKMDVQRMEYGDNTFDAIINLNMVHLVSDPVIMLNELARVIKKDGHFFIADLRRSWLGIFEREIQSAFSLEEAAAILKKSNLGDGSLQNDLLWWYYENQ